MLVTVIMIVTMMLMMALVVMTVNTAMAEAVAVVVAPAVVTTVVVLSSSLFDLMALYASTEKLPWSNHYQNTCQSRLERSVENVRWRVTLALCLLEAASRISPLSQDY